MRAAWPWAHSRALPLSHGGYARGPYQRSSGHVLPLHTRRESCAARSHHGAKGRRPCRDDIYCPCGPHSFLSISRSGSPAKHGLSAGCTEGCWQVSGLSFSGNRHDSVTWFGLVAFLLLRQSSTHLSSLHKTTPIFNYQVPSKGNRGLRQWSWAQGVTIHSQLIWGKRFHLSAVCYLGKRNRPFLLPVSTGSVLVHPLTVLKITVFIR